MSINGRILFYNSQTGEGKLILDTKEKIDFSVDVWDDFEVGPQSNILVECDIEDGILKSIKASPLDEPMQKSNFQKQETQKMFFDEDGGARYSVSETLKNYFSHIEDVIGEPPEIINTKAQLDYFLSKRFLLTAYNNLRGLDPSLYERKNIKEKINTIEELHKAYNSITEKIDIPHLAFEMIFLRVQPEYIEYQKKKEKYLNNIPILTKLINSLEPELKKGEGNLKVIKNPKISTELKNKLKKIRGRYVDAIHERACITEELSEMPDIKAIYTDRYFHDFERELSILQVKYKDMISRILNYKAYDLDVSIWQNASKSKMIQEYFKDAGIKGGYSTKTFLRYYLETLDKDKVKEEQEELFKLLDYLEKITK
ncbi:hypothetical protein FJR48_04120 [Sulfurimonas lithotrophica]|uniref:Uncharacterized protein n=1 Tax=Sulfurimonas lithotrophica TaxID=2590022 RepID=A0A5P8NZS4_9BACT|nr:hypothetical protein [Sulfurimonas lithotrophica]QFR48949.1 hypothetical protein FJR48_04120 [Sulfurimonas lithotrophica]